MNKHLIVKLYFMMAIEDVTQVILLIFIGEDSVDGASNKPS